MEKYKVYVNGMAVCIACKKTNMECDEYKIFFYPYLTKAEALCMECLKMTPEENSNIDNYMSGENNVV